MLSTSDYIKTVQELDKAKQTLELAMQIGGLGNFFIDIETGTATYSQQVADWFGMNSLHNSVSAVFDKIHPEDVRRVTTVIAHSMGDKNGGKHDLVYRILHPQSGAVAYLHSIGQVKYQDDKPVAINGIIQDVTMQTGVTRKLEASESRLRSLVESAPFPIGVYTGREMRIWLANQSILNIWGKGNDVIGKLYSEILPELENQEIFKQLDQVFTSGISIHKRNQRVELVANDHARVYYFNYSFTPLFDEEGKIYGVMNTAADITDLALARRRAEEAEAGLYSAIALADLGAWTQDAVTGIISYTPRIREWFGLDTDTAPRESVYKQIHEKDQERVIAGIQRALDPSGNGLYDEEYTAVARDTGRERILHAQGQTVFNPDNTPAYTSGIILDVTMQRQQQLALENQVQERTGELAASNEELRSTNEELAQANELLIRSNEDLGQYAYVASHDLQEPLRKIRMFATALSRQQALPEDTGTLAEKIDASAHRMSQLISDLLEFSKLKADRLVRPVNLAEIAANVVDDFELLIEEKGAQVVIGELPRIEAVALQMNQLFYNLLSNALKFTRQKVQPQIRIKSQPAGMEEVKTYVAKPLPFAQYYHISVEDNGIGFETQYGDQIFEIFKRLHGREAYPGSGIGLAVCRRIADNHHGKLYAESVPQEGSAFHLFLPDRQHENVSALPVDFKWTND